MQLKKLKVVNIVQKIVVALGSLCIIIVIFTLTISDQWWMRVFDYPRLQIALATGIILLISILILNRHETWVKLYLVVLTLAWGHQSYTLLAYTPLTARQVPDREIDDPTRTFSLLSANVRMENRDAQAFLELVTQYRPDLFLVLEPDTWWTDQLRPLREQYEHYVEYPQDNYYGIALYSRLPLQNPEINFFEREEVPSFRTVLQLESGDEILFYGIHPRPPLPDNSVSAADKELIKIAKLTQEAELPTIVAGDFNDVPWSFTVNEFQEIGQLRDIRVGRGLYNTFPANYPFLRLPLDHLFISPGLGLVEIAKPLAFSSDHLALYVKLTVDETLLEAP